MTGKEALATEYKKFGANHGWALAKILVFRSFQTTLKLILSIFVEEEIDKQNLKSHERNQRLMLEYGVFKYYIIKKLKMYK